MSLSNQIENVRETSLLFGWKAPVDPRPAATVMLLRDGTKGLEVMMTRRSMTASFAPGAYVFPGGRVDSADKSWAETLSDPQASSDRQLTTAFALAAIRESFEELGLVLARDEAGQWPGSEAIEKMDRSGNTPFVEVMAANGLTPALDAIHWFTHWVTDRDLPKRFDTRFFVAVMPAGQQAVADESEQFEPVWVNPSEALQRHDDGQFEMVFPTIRTLRHLSNYASASEVLAFAETLDPVADTKRWQSCPRAGYLRGNVERFSENESAYGELEMVSPDGTIHHTLDWQHEPVALLRYLWRVTAPNPGRMTGPGTNSYVIGDGNEFVVVDPGPNHPEHLSRLAGLVTGKLVAIVCTHSHPDHYPGAAPLRDLIGQTGVPILGRLAGPDFNPNWVFEPDRELQDNEILTCGSETIRMLHTPGHASNHVCLLLERDRLLLSGDHILNGSTTVIDHPDGNMLDYMSSLHRLRAEPVNFILPAHGYVLGEPVAHIDGLIKHRLKREAKVLNAVKQAGPATIDELVVIAYDDVNVQLHPVAKRSLTAHLHKLHEEAILKFDVQALQWAVSA